MHAFIWLSMIVWVVEYGETHQFKKKDRALWAAAISSVLLLMGSNHIAFITIPMLPPCSFWNDIFTCKSISIHHSWSQKTILVVFQWSYMNCRPSFMTCSAVTSGMGLWFGHHSCWSSGPHCRYATPPSIFSVAILNPLKSNTSL